MPCVHKNQFLRLTSRLLVLAVIEVCLSAVPGKLWAQPGVVGGGPGPLNDVWGEILLNPQVNGSPTTLYTQGDNLTLGATAFGDVLPQSPTNYKFSVSMQFYGVFQEDGIGWIEPLNDPGSSDSNATSPDHVAPGGTGTVGGVIYVDYATSYSFYRGQVTLSAQSYVPASGAYGSSGQVLAKEIEFTVDPNL